jgi:hypothetical protein
MDTLLVDVVRYTVPDNVHQLHNLSRRAAADIRLRPRGHWDRQLGVILRLKRNVTCLHVTFCGGRSQKYLARVFHVEYCFKLANSEYSCDGKL